MQALKYYYPTKEPSFIFPAEALSKIGVWILLNSTNKQKSSYLFTCVKGATIAAGSISETLSNGLEFLVFQQLVKQWRKERGATSSIIEMAMCPSYQRIMAMGEKALPFIFRQLQIEGDEPDMWFWALKLITNDDPVDIADQGNMCKMAQAWLGWAQKNYGWQLASTRFSASS